MNLVVGTAGHIDHGKTALIEALTGTNTDRLPEEKQRGITIDLGFAELRLGSLQIGFVDVPGHEKFVRNMLAGVSGIDLVLLMVAANEGVMPQTREHFEICRLLGIQAGIVVLTKSDLADQEMVELVKLDVAQLTENSFLENSPVVLVSSKSGEGVADLKDAIVTAARGLPKRIDCLVPIMPIDRSFTVKGFGPVVTGTLLSGSIGEGTDLELLPAGKRVRVRGAQTQGRLVETASAGQRIALNLSGVDHSELARGMTLAEAGVVEPTQVIDTELEVVADAARPVRSRQRVKFHIGAAEVLGRIDVLNDARLIEPGRKDFAQVRLDSAIVAVPGDRFILRSYSPQATIAGGEVLDAHARRHRKKDLGLARAFLTNLAGTRGDTIERARLFIAAAGRNGMSVKELRSKTGYLSSVAESAIGALVETSAVIRSGDHLIDAEAFAVVRTLAVDTIRDAGKLDPITRGVSREYVRDRAFGFIEATVFDSAIAHLQSAGLIDIENDLLRLAGQTNGMSEAQQSVLESFRKIYNARNYEVPKLDEAIRTVSLESGSDMTETRKIFQFLVSSKEVVKISAEFYFNRQAIDDLVFKLRDYASLSPDRSIDVPKFKELAGMSRKYAIPVLEYCDSSRITVRHGDKRRVI